VLDYGLRRQKARAEYQIAAWREAHRGRQNRERLAGWMTCFGFEWTRRSQQLAHDEIRGSTQDQPVALLCRPYDGQPRAVVKTLIRSFG
jgi:hypothetical protein